MFRRLLAADQSVFYLINGAHCRFLDGFMVVVTYLGETWVLIPLMAILFILTFKKRTWPLFLLVVVTLLTSDAAAHWIKPHAARLRPSHALPNVHILMNYTGGQYGFPSSHATNSFALAVLLGWAWPRRRWAFIGLALLISYSRIYLGVHYPGDILGGAALGSLIAGLLLISYRELSRLYPSLAWRPASKEECPSERGSTGI